MQGIYTYDRVIYRWVDKKKKLFVPIYFRWLQLHAGRILALKTINVLFLDTINHFVYLYWLMWVNNIIYMHIRFWLSFIKSSFIFYCFIYIFPAYFSYFLLNILPTSKIKETSSQTYWFAIIMSFNGCRLRYINIPLFKTRLNTNGEFLIKKTNPEKMCYHYYH